MSQSLKSSGPVLEVAKLANKLSLIYFQKHYNQCQSAHFENSDTSTDVSHDKTLTLEQKCSRRQYSVNFKPNSIKSVIKIVQKLSLSFIASANIK